ncbi:MAG: hypothetical protein HDQ91_06355 [Desulfovibrio sp.]|nr:hypothetical protein [Desulfovibrio sp.]
MGAGKAETRRVLTPAELESLTDAWSIWIGEAATPGRRLARLRLHLFFLLARFGGLRLAEIASFTPSQLDLATGYLRLEDRGLFMPAGAMRAARRILALAEAGNPEFLRLDSGFLRRAFYGVAELAGLPPALCAPRALRYARANELLAMRMPLELVARSLGFKNPLQLAALFPPACENADNSPNSLAGLVLRLEAGQRSARLLIELAPGTYLQVISPLADLLAIEPRPGHAARLHIPPACIFPAANFPDSENRLACALADITGDQFEICLTLGLGSRLKLQAVMSPLVTDFTKFRPGKNFAVHIPPHLIRLR